MQRITSCSDLNGVHLVRIRKFSLWLALFMGFPSGCQLQMGTLTDVCPLSISQAYESKPAAMCAMLVSVAAVSDVLRAARLQK